MSPQDRAYFLERATIERELARSAPAELLAVLHLEIAARYEALVNLEDQRPRLGLVVNNAAGA